MRFASLLILFFFLSCSSLIDDESGRHDDNQGDKIGSQNANSNTASPKATPSNPNTLSQEGITNLQADLSKVSLKIKGAKAEVPLAGNAE